MENSTIYRSFRDAQGLESKTIENGSCVPPFSEVLFDTLVNHPLVFGKKEEKEFKGYGRAQEVNPGIFERFLGELH